MAGSSVPEDAVTETDSNGCHTITSLIWGTHLNLAARSEPGRDLGEYCRFNRDHTVCEGDLTTKVALTDGVGVIKFVAALIRLGREADAAQLHTFFC
jgi:hypothetical protein